MNSKETSEIAKPEVKAKHRQVIRGIVVSDKMNKTRIIEVFRRVKHSLYNKGLVRKSRIFVHDEKNSTKVGDFIMASSTRPLSKNKHFTLLKVVNREA